jgi:hypothetical protein
MMADTGTSMHTDFARWYSAIGIADDQSRRLTRWKVVDSLASAADRDDIEALIRLAFRTRHGATIPVLQSFRDAFKAEDDAFEMCGNDRELQVLSGACLAVLMQRGGENGAAAALAVTTAALGGGRRPDLPMDLVILAEGAIDRIADVNRERPSLVGHTPAEAPKLDYSAAAAKARESSWESVALAFSLAEQATQGAIEILAQRQVGAIQTIDRFVRIQDEELQMLWWLVGQRSGDLDCAFDKVPLDAQPLVFAKELADCTTLLPGPSSVKGLLSRAGLKEHRKVTIAALINAATTAWLQDALGSAHPSPVTMPLHYAIERQLETGAGDAWIAGWSAACETDAAHSLSTLTLGTLFYRERLLNDFE